MSEAKSNYFCHRLVDNLCKLLTLLSVSLLILSFIQNVIDKEDILTSRSVMAQVPSPQSQSQSTPSNNSGSSIQQWFDKINNIRIQFSNIPQSPTVDAKTQLRFVVQNLTNSKNINDIHARVVVATNNSGQLRTFKFENISSANGNFNVDYIFPDSGIYQIMTRVDSNNSSTLGSFKVNVPFQPLGTFSAPTPSFISIIIAGIIIAVAAVSLLLVLQRRQKISR